MARRKDAVQRGPYWFTRGTPGNTKTDGYTKASDAKKAARLWLMDLLQGPCRTSSSDVAKVGEMLADLRDAPLTGSAPILMEADLESVKITMELRMRA